MNRFLPAVTPMLRTAGLVALVTMTFGDLALAADLSLINKAPPQAPADPSPFWAEMEYLAWTVKGDRLPPLVTTSAPAQAGVLGAPGTTVLFGDSSVNGGWRSGGRLSAGYWFDPQHRNGIEANFFGLAQASTGFGANSGGTPLLARPFFDALTNLQNSSLVASPGVLSGSVTANETSGLYGAGALYRHEIGASAGALGTERYSLLAGYRYLHSSDRLDISSTSTVLGGGVVPAGTVFAPTDSFHARSDFHGLDLGVTGEYMRGPWMLEWRAKLALGANINVSQVNGSTAVTLGGVTTTSPGGLLALPTNIGNSTQTRVALVPDFAVKGGYQLAPAWRVVASYEVLYWTEVQRAAGLIDTTINPNLIPPAPGGGPLRPQPLFNTSALLAQGFSLGIRHDF